MTVKHIYENMNITGSFFLATTDGQKPYVREMMLYEASPKNGIIFHTSAFKDIPKQIANNPNVELCFKTSKGAQIRVSGIAEEVTDREVKNQILSHPSRAFLQDWKNSVLDEDEFYKTFIVYAVKNCEAVVWTYDTNLEPKVSIKI